VTEASPRSALAALRARREGARNERHLDLRVPGLEPPLFVRYGPVAKGVAEDITDRWKNSKDKDATVKREAQLLAEACRGLFELDDSGNKVSPDPDDRGGDWPRFDEHLARLIGSDKTSALDLLREVYEEDGDIMAASQKYAFWWQREAIELASQDDPGN
jgi:hypothetical protein